MCGWPRPWPNRRLTRPRYSSAPGARIPHITRGRIVHGWSHINLGMGHTLLRVARLCQEACSSSSNDSSCDEAALAAALDEILGDGDLSDAEPSAAREEGVARPSSSAAPMRASRGGGPTTAPAGRRASGADLPPVPPFCSTAAKRKGTVSGVVRRAARQCRCRGAIGARAHCLLPQGHSVPGDMYPTGACALPHEQCLRAAGRARSPSRVNGCVVGVHLPARRPCQLVPHKRIRARCPQSGSS